MSTQTLVIAAALSLLAVTHPLRAEPPAAAVEALAATTLLPAAAAAAVEAPQALADVEVEAGAVPALTPAQRRDAHRKAREELRRRFGPSIHVFN